MKKSDIPLLVSIILLLAILILWFFPSNLGIINQNYNIIQYHSDLKDLIGIFYIALTLWLVLVTRKMAQVSLNSQKAINRPELLCELFISNEKPKAEQFKSIKNLEIRSTSDGEYLSNTEGASVFIIIKNRDGGGKAINLVLAAKLHAKNPENLTLERNLTLDFLAEGDAIALYIYRFISPSNEQCSLKLLHCNLSFSTPFSEASNDNAKLITYDLGKPILATGNHIGAIKLEHGIRIIE